ncbi:MAG: YecA family protein [Rhizobiaceae bacterium]
MAGLAPDLQKLDTALAALPAESDAMLLSELDGLLAGVVVCPALIMPNEWLPEVFGSRDDGGGSETAKTLEQLVDLILRHYNTVVRDLDRGRFAPIYDMDEHNNDVWWELWMGGFSRAMALRPDSWDAIADSDDEVAAGSIMTLTTLSIIAAENSDAVQEFRETLDDNVVETLRAEAPDLIPGAIMALHRWRTRSTASRTNPAPRRRKVGRNDACPCGSGRKYKRCCGAN